MAFPAFIKAVSKVSSEVSKAEDIAEGNYESLAAKNLTKGITSNFNPDKRVEVKNENGEVKFSNQDSYNPDKRIGKEEIKQPEDIKNDIPNESDLVSPGELYTDPEKRISWAQTGDGEWRGEPGKSEFVPNKQEAKDALSKHGEDSIRYDSNGEPDFSKVADETVEIDNMTEFRRGAGNNFDQADAKLAEKWNNECRNGKTDWTKSDVREWADNKENNITRHERLDKRTVDYVDSDIHEECKHFGGCAECKARDRIGGIDFDE